MKLKDIISLIAIVSFLPLNVVSAQEVVDPAFDPGLLVPDTAFMDAQTFGSSAGVQQFLENKGSVLARTDAQFLAKLREPSDTNLKTKLEDPNPSLSRLRTAAELIYDASTSNGLNPQVILVTLQKEQSLILKNFTSEADLQRALDRSLGYGCPDGSPCQANFLGFYHQLFGNLDSSGDRWIGAAKSLAKSFNEQRGPLIDADNRVYGGEPKVRQARKGDTVTFENTLNGFIGVQQYQTVTIRNIATAALYRYTPHVFNGNYNFWRYFQKWFKYPNGTIIKLFNDPTLWVIDNGQRRKFSDFVALQRGIDTSEQITVSPTEFSSYDQGAVLPPRDGTILRSNADSVTYYLIDNGVRYTVTLFTARQRGLNLGEAVTLADSEVKSYQDAGLLLPQEGTLFKTNSDQTVYIMSGNQKRPLTYDVFVARGYNFANVVTLPHGEVSPVPTGALMPPPDGTLIKGESTFAVYYLDGGLKRWVSYNVFINRGFDKKPIVKLPDSFMSSIGDGLPMAPTDNTLVKLVDDPTIFVVYQGVKTPITFTVFMQRRLYERPLLVLSNMEMDSLSTDDFALPPRDGTLVRAAGDPTVYLVEKGQLRPLSLQAFNNRKFKWSDVIQYPAEEVSLFEKGEAIIN